MFGKDLTPVKQQMHVPGLVWGSIGMEAGLSRKRKVSLRYIRSAKCELHGEWAVLFELILILPWAGKLEWLTRSYRL